MSRGGELKMCRYRATCSIMSGRQAVVGVNGMTSNKREKWICKDCRGVLRKVETKWKVCRRRKAFAAKHEVDKVDIGEWVCRV